jgi:hypothetical protein
VYPPSAVERYLLPELRLADDPEVAARILAVAKTTTRAGALALLAFVGGSILA